VIHYKHPNFCGLVRDEAGHVWRIAHGAEVPSGYTLLTNVCNEHGILKNSTAWAFFSFEEYLKRPGAHGRVMKQHEIDALSRPYGVSHLPSGLDVRPYLDRLLADREAARAKPEAARDMYDMLLVCATDETLRGIAEEQRDDRAREYGE